MLEKRLTHGFSFLTTGNHKKRLVILVLLLVMLVQCAVLVFWQGQRGNYYIDELFSFGYAKTFSLDTPSALKDGNWRYEVWMDSDEMRDQLIVTEEDSVLSLPFTETINMLATKRTYMGFLNIAMSLTKPFKGYCYSILALNILFFLISEVLLALCIRKLTKNDIITVLSVTMFGFSAIMMGMCEFIRFYMLATMLLLLVVFCHLKLWDTGNRIHFLVWEIVAFISAYYGLMHSELFLVICGSFFCFFFFSLLIRKKFVNAIIYSVPLLIGVYYYVYQRTNLFEIIFHPSNFAMPHSHGSYKVTYNLLTITPDRAGECLLLIRNCLIDKWFGGAAVAILFLALFILWAVVIVIERINRDEDSHFDNKHIGFIILLALTALTGITFNVLTDLSEDRYQVFPIVLLMIVFWFLVDRLGNRLQDKRLIAAIVIVTILSAIGCQQSENYPFLYTNDKVTTDRVEQYKGTDCILFDSAKKGDPLKHVKWHPAEECIVYSGGGARVYVLDPYDEGTISKEEMPTRFIAWCVKGDGVKKMFKTIEKADYEKKYLGSTYVSKVYLCTKK